MAARKNTDIPDFTTGEDAKQALALAEQPVELPAIESDADFERMLEIARELASRRKEIEDKHKELKAPILQAGRRLDEFFRAALSKIKPHEDAARDAMVSYKQRREAEARKASQLAASAGGAGVSFRPSGFGAMRELSTMPAPAQVAGFGTRKSYRAKVVDMQALVAHCAATGTNNWLLPNQKLLDDAASQAKDQRPLDIPGVEVEMTESAVLR